MKGFQKAFYLSVILLVLTIGVSGQTIEDDYPVVQLMNEYSADLGSVNRFYHIDGSPERNKRLEKLSNSYLLRLESIDFKKLSISEQVDYILTRNKIHRHLKNYEQEAANYTKIEKWISFADTIYAIEKKRRRGTRFDAKMLAEQLDVLQKEVVQCTKKLANSGQLFTSPEIRFSKLVINGQLEALNSVYSFYAGYDPNFSWWVKKPYEKIEAKLHDLIGQFEASIDSARKPEDDGSGIIGHPIGRKALIEQLESEFIPYTPEELVKIAEKEFAWCDAEMLKVSKEMGFGKDWKKALEKVKNTYVEEGTQPETMLQLYNESVTFLKQKDLITIPPIAEETWRMTMISPERQRFSPFFLGGEVLQIAYPTDAMDHDQKMMSMRGNNPHFSRAVIHHELIAGHHLQQFMNHRYQTHRNYHTPFWTEGWALYWELTLWEQGFPQSPEDKVGMLFWRMHRCARIMFSLNYHMGEWTPQQCIDYLVERVGHERANAESEVRRSFEGQYGPLYQIAYMTGGMQFYQLQKELVDSGKMTYKEFHDAVMRQNNMPVELLRAILTEGDLNPNYKSVWRFYDYK